jgi:hypothetical protein
MIAADCVRIHDYCQSRNDAPSIVSGSGSDSNLTASEYKGPKPGAGSERVASQGTIVRLGGERAALNTQLVWHAWSRATSPLEASSGGQA